MKILFFLFILIFFTHAGKTDQAVNPKLLSVSIARENVQNQKDLAEELDKAPVVICTNKDGKKITCPDDDEDNSDK